MRGIFVLIFGIIDFVNIHAQPCDNTVQWPTSAVAISCGANVIATNQWAGDFNLTQGYADQSTLKFSSSTLTDFITIRRASDNAIIAAGDTPLEILYQSSYGTLEMHLNTNAACGTQNVARTTGVFVKCGCNNNFQWPTSIITINQGTNTIATDQFAGDYNLTTGYQDEALCTFSSSNETDFITLRRASNNTIIESGLTPVTIDYRLEMGNIEMHINSTVNCGIQNVFRTTTILHNKNSFLGGANDGYASHVVLDANPSDIPMAMYQGGENDGYASHVVLEANPSDIPMAMYQGGDNDGYAYHLVLEANPSDTPMAMYQGGENDGYASHVVLDANPSDIPMAMYQGGDNDGYAYHVVLDANPSDIPMAMYQGGDNDGYASHLVLEANPSDTPMAMYQGGVNDGYSRYLKINANPDCTDNFVRWSGEISSSWDNPGNWDCGLLPSVNDEVIISAMALFQPTVNITTEIKKLVMNNGASIIILNGIIFLLNGL